MKLRFVFCIAILSTAATALASETPQNDKPAQAPAATDGAAAMRVFVDPATGELVSKPVTEAQRYAAEADTSFEETKSRAVESAATDGSPMVILNGEAEVALSVHSDAQGHLHTACNEASHQHQATPAQEEAAQAAGER